MSRGVSMAYAESIESVPKPDRDKADHHGQRAPSLRKIYAG